MKKCAVGIDAHKETNVLALAFNDMQPSTVYGKISTDLNRTVEAIRKILKKYDLQKEDLQICYRPGRSQAQAVGVGGLLSDGESYPESIFYFGSP